MTSVSIRPATAGDVLHLEAMLVHAANWDPEQPATAPAEVMARPELAHYVEGWGRDGDVGVVAERDGVRIGAAWARRFAADDPGYGFVHGDVPELAVGVAPEARDTGVGAALLRALLGALATADVGQVSLNTNLGNPALRLYRRLGFRAVRRIEDGVTMIADTATEVIERRLGRLRIERFDHPAAFVVTPSGYAGARLVRDALDRAEAFGRDHPGGWAYVIDPSDVALLNPANVVTLRRVHRLPNIRHYIVATRARRFRAAVRLTGWFEGVTAVAPSVDEVLTGALEDAATSKKS